MPTIKPANGEATTIIPTMIITGSEIEPSRYIQHTTAYAIDMYGTKEEVNVVKLALKEGEGLLIREKQGDTHQYNLRLQHPSGRRNEFIYHEETYDDIVHLFAVHNLLQPDFGEIEAWEKPERDLSTPSTFRPLSLSPIVFGAEADMKALIWDMMQRYNTPLLPEWRDTLIQKLEDDGMIDDLHVEYFKYREGNEEERYVAKRLRFSESRLEKTITQMIQSYELPFALDAMHDSSTFDQLGSLTGYIERFAPDLARSVQENVDVLFDPTEDTHHESIRDLNLFANKKGLTGMFAPQADTVMATSETLTRQKFSFLSGEMGVGKTLMGSVIPYVHAHKRGHSAYRAVVLSPKSLLLKWEREIKSRVPEAKVVHVSTYEDLVHLKGAARRPDKPEYYIISQTAFKAGYPLDLAGRVREGLPTPATMDTLMESAREQGASGLSYEYTFRFGMSRIFAYENDTVRCPDCGHVESIDQFRPSKTANVRMTKENRKCKNPRCNTVRWSAKALDKKSKLRKVSPAWYINKHFKRGFFEYLLVDEAHEYKSGDTEIGRALGQLINHCKYKVMMTGTLFGGNATDLFYLLARLNPDKLKHEGMTYYDETRFHNFYGVTEHVVTEHKLTGKLQSRKMRRPGINPTLYPMHLMPNSVFLEIADLGFALPPYEESARFVQLDDHMRDIYDDMFGHAAAFHNVRANSTANRELFPNYNAIQVVNQINNWLDRPYRYDTIGVNDVNGVYHPIYHTPNREEGYRNNKLDALEETIVEELGEGRKLLVYVKDVDGKRPELGLDIHLYQELTARGYNVGILRSNGSTPFGGSYPTPDKREKWLRDMQEEHGWDVLITNPSLVKVGLDLYEYPTVVFYQYGMSSFEYMQAARRSWRIGQQNNVKVITFAYESTPQQHYLEMLASKIDAALTIQGKLTEDGLRNLSESTSDLAKLAKSIMEGDALSSVETVHERFKRINTMSQAGTDGLSELYKDYEQNPIEGGLETLSLIKSGLFDPFKDAVEAEFEEIVEEVIEEVIEKPAAVVEAPKPKPAPVVIPPELYDPEEMFKPKAVTVKRKATKEVVELEQFELQLF